MLSDLKAAARKAAQQNLKRQPRVWPKKGNDNHITLSGKTCASQELADLFGYSKKSVEAIAVKKSHGKYLLRESVAAIIAYRENRKKNQHDGEAGSDYETHRTRLTGAKADMAEMQAAIIKGTVHEAHAVESVWTDHLLACRAKLLSMPKKLAPRIHGIEKITSIEAEIDAVITEALNELANYDPALITDRYVSENREELDAATEMEGEPVGRLKSQAQS
jgi:phage terminase Nu1 subunit (DNA packaging protein)